MAITSSGLMCETWKLRYAIESRVGEVGATCMAGDIIEDLNRPYRYIARY